MPYYLGLDGGGTKTAAVILDEERRELGRGQGGPCNVATCSDVVLRASVLEASRSALAAAKLPPDTQFAAACAGVAGYTAKGRRADFARPFADAIPAAAHRLEPDYVIAWWGATEGEPGVIVIAGTGAVAYGRNVAGQSARADGRGFLLGDRGSGFDIGRQALAHALENAGARRQDALTTGILEATGCQDADDLIEWTYRGFEPARIAKLAAVVGRLADEDANAARGIVMVAGMQLGLLVSGLLSELDLPASSVPIHMLGGLWVISKVLRQEFYSALARDAGVEPPNLKQPKNGAAVGAALLAMSEAA